MGYGDPKDRTLDKTVAWVTSCLCMVAVVIICWIGYNYNYDQVTERKALEAGYCQVRNAPETQTLGYHWEKCK